MSGAVAVDTKSEQSDPIETILVVVDEVLIGMAIAEYLRDCGYRVVEAKLVSGVGAPLAARR